MIIDSFLNTCYINRGGGGREHTPLKSTTLVYGLGKVKEIKRVRERETEEDPFAIIFFPIQTEPLTIKGSLQ